MAAADPDRIVFRSSIVTIGEWRLSPSHPNFEDTGPARNHCFVFPRHACWIEHEGERPFVADSTTVPLYNPGRPYRRGLIDPAGDASDWFGVSSSVLGDTLSRFDSCAADAPPAFARGAVAAPAGLFLYQRRVFNHANATASAHVDAMYVEESVLTLLDAVLRKSRDEARLRPPRATQVIDAPALAACTRAHIGRTFRQHESIADVGRALGVSPFHLCRVFRRETGFSLHRFRTELRLRWSLQPLADGVDILTTALDAGFAHHSHFTSAFRRTFGVTPSAFRQHQRRTGRVMPLEMMKTRPE